MEDHTQPDVVVVLRVKPLKDKRCNYPVYHYQY